MLLEIDIDGKGYSFKDDLPYGELVAMGDRDDPIWPLKMVAALSLSPKITLEVLKNTPSKTMTRVMAEVLNNYSKDFPTPPKNEE